jgi:hypothetical protein
MSVWVISDRDRACSKSGHIRYAAESGSRFGALGNRILPCRLVAFPIMGIARRARPALTAQPLREDDGGVGFTIGKAGCVNPTGPAMMKAKRDAILQNPRDAAISADFIARTGEICMIIVTSQIAPSRPMLMLDAWLAL